MVHYTEIHQDYSLNKQIQRKSHMNISLDAETHLIKSNTPSC